MPPKRKLVVKTLAEKCQALKELEKEKKIRDGKFSEVDLVVFKWFVSQRSKNIPIDGTILKEKAKSYAQELGVEDSKASDGWLGKWKKSISMQISKNSLSRTFHEIRSLCRTSAISNARYLELFFWSLGSSR
ncbi:tigger transposable element-derived protein 2-like [Hydractinia symbiolongicarpus]|uniref:tigger transposable element-derived protein 2-like n=1 Tax=Hydractinia symbiolongicarpus TaxID=13093 RepID=UPI002550842A|nr:tigger transposable element-derived protein 2-like [Hydractinia symbiolongicarpus]